MRTPFSLDTVLAVGVDPHRESLDVVAIHFPEEIVLDEAFDNTRAGHRALWTKAQALAHDQSLSLIFGLEDGSNYGYALGRFLVNQGGCVKEVNPRMTNRQRDFYGEDKTNRLDALATAAIVFRAFDRLPDVTAVQEATEATQELSRYREQLVKEQTAKLNRLHRYLANQYPTYKTFFSKLNGVTALHFWATYPTPAQLRATTLDELADFLHDKSKHSLGAEAARQKARHIFNALDDALLRDLGLLAEAQGAIIRDLAQRLLQLKRGIEAIEAKLEETVPATGQQLETFQAAMTSSSTLAGHAVVSAYDFGGIMRIADVGGGHGALLASILRHYPNMQGVLFDREEIVGGVPEDQFAGCDGRIAIESGSFFERVPDGCDAYIMKHIIHDWSDEHCCTILRLMRERLPANGRVLLCEMVVTDEPGPTPAKMLDIEMLLVTVGGKERTKHEFAELLGSCGLHLNRIVATERPIYVIEAVCE